MSRRSNITSSVRGERTLADLGILKAFDRGDNRVLIGPIFTARKDPTVEMRLLFERQETGQVLVGYARRNDKQWETVESEPFTLRSYGYYERRLKRIGDFLRNQPPLKLL